MDKEKRDKMGSIFLKFGLSGIKGFVLSLSTCAFTFVAIYALRTYLKTLGEDITSFLDMSTLFTNHWMIFLFSIWAFNTWANYKELSK